MRDDEAYFKPDARDMVPMVYSDTMRLSPLFIQMDKEHERRLKAYRDYKKMNPLLSEEQLLELLVANN